MPRAAASVSTTEDVDFLERFQLIARATNDVIWDWDYVLGTVFWSEAIERVLGYRPEEAGATIAEANAWWRERLHPRDRERVVESLRQAIEGDAETWTNEYRFRRADGSYAVLLDRGYLARDEAGGFTRMLGSMVDLTELRRAQELTSIEKRVLEHLARGAELRAVLEELTSALEEQIDEQKASILLLEDGKLWQGAGASLPTSYSEAIDGIEIGPAVGSCGTAAFTGEPVITADITTDSRWAPFRELALAHDLRACWSVPILDGRREVLGTFALYRARPSEPTGEELAFLSGLAHVARLAIEHARADAERAQLYERERRARRSVDAARRQLEAILDLLPVGVILVEPGTGRILRANQAADDMAGGEFPKAGSVEQYDELYYCTDQAGERIPPDELPGALAARGETLKNFEMDWHTPRGVRSLVISSEVLPSIEGFPAAAILAFEDISRIKRAERKLQAAVEARDEFLAVASHELRTPVSALMLQLEMLRRKSADLAGTAGTAAGEPRGTAAGDPGALAEQAAALSLRVTRTERQAERLVELVERLLDVSRITAGRLDLELERVDLGEIASEVAERFRDESAPERLRVAIEPGVIGSWDRLRLEQVVSNLLSNAAKYGREKPVELVVRREGDEAVLEVTDRGAGIDREQQPRIFDRFERAPSDRTLGGFGLGLWITRQIVEALGGEISVESSPGKGSTFRVLLPAAEEPW